MKYLPYIKYTIILIAVCAAVWFIKDYFDKVEFRKQTIENQTYQLRFDSLKASYSVLDKEQMLLHLKENVELKKILKENNIKNQRVMSVLNHLLKYRDTTIVNTDLSPILDAINSKSDYIQPFKDSTSCLVIKGNINYINGALSAEINERTFLGNTTAIAYWERREWKFLGIKTRLFGKKQGTVKVVDKCGESQIVNIDKKD